ncbi:MAG: hypothetical protein ACT4RN_22395 [Pseudonocardia sp.]
MTTIEPAEAGIERFAGELLGMYRGLTTLMIDLAHRTWLLETLGGGPGTSAELAERAGLVERYVRECLGALVTAGIAGYDPASGRYELPAAHAACLTGPGSLNLAPLAAVTTLLGRHVPAVADCFRHGGGVPYEAVRPEFTAVMDGASPRTGCSS